MKEWYSWSTFKLLKKIFLIEINPDIQRYSFSGGSSFNDAKNTSILNSTIQYIFDTKRFDVTLTNLSKLQKFEWFIYWAASSMNWGELILIRLIFGFTLCKISLFEQVFVDWDSRFTKIYLPGDCGFYFQMCKCWWYIKKKLKESRIIVNTQRIINMFGSFNGIVIALKTIINNKEWNNAWTVSLLNSNMDAVDKFILEIQEIICTLFSIWQL